MRALAGLPVDLDRKVELAFHAILRHELFHFATDCMIANWELATRREVYWKAKAAHRNGSGYVELEEALANAYMLRGFKWPTQALKQRGAYIALCEYCDKHQPAGYKEGPHYARSHRKFIGGCQSLSADYQHASVTDPDLKVPPALDLSVGLGRVYSTVVHGGISIRWSPWTPPLSVVVYLTIDLDVDRPHLEARGLTAGTLDGGPLALTGGSARPVASGSAQEPSPLCLSSLQILPHQR